jgi:hydrogenase maturation protease
VAVPTRPILILGLGNILMRDEGVGVRVVEAMRGMDWPPAVEIMEGGTAGLGLLDTICDRERVIVLDAVQCEGGPGTVVQFRVNPAQAGSIPSAPVSLHEVGFVEVLRAARLLNAAPREVIVLGVKPAAVESGLELSPEVVAAIPKVIEAAKALAISGVADRPKVV